MPGAGFWRSKPGPGVELDRSHPLARGLVGCWLLAEGDGRLTANLAQPGMGDGTLNDVTWGGGPSGPTLGTFVSGGVGSTYVDCTADPRLNPTGAMSIVALVYPTSTGNFLATALGRDDNALGRAYAFGLSNADVNAQINGTPVTGRSGVVANRWQTIAATGGQNQGWVMWLDGTPGTAAAWVAPASTTGATRIGQRTYSGNNDGWPGRIAHVYLYDVELTPEQVASLTADPYQMFAPPAWRRYFVPQAAAPATRVQRLSLLGVG